MSDEEYNNAIIGILTSGRGYQALIDITNSLKVLNDNMTSVMREMRAERKMVKKICENNNTSAKKKIETILVAM